MTRWGSSSDNDSVVVIAVNPESNAAVAEITAVTDPAAASPDNTGSPDVSAPETVGADSADAGTDSVTEAGPEAGAEEDDSE